MRPLQQNDVFHAIAHPAHRAMLVMLKGDKRPVNELAGPFGISLVAVLQHLKILKESDLVAERRMGRRRIYHLRPKPLRQVVHWVGEFEALWSAPLDALTEHLDRKCGKRKG